MIGCQTLCSASICLVHEPAAPNASPETTADDGACEEVFPGEGVPDTREHLVAGPSREKDLITEIGKKQWAIPDTFAILP